MKMWETEVRSYDLSHFSPKLDILLHADFLLLE